jgi:hypothetical protein
VLRLLKMSIQAIEFGTELNSQFSIPQGPARIRVTWAFSFSGAWHIYGSWRNFVQTQYGAGYCLKKNE